MSTTTTIYETFFNMRRGLEPVRLSGLPSDMTIREAERLVRMIRTLAFPEDSIEVCACRSGAAAPGYPCPACGERIPQREREASERIAGMTPEELIAEAFFGMQRRRFTAADASAAFARGASAGLAAREASMARGLPPGPGAPGVYRAGADTLVRSFVIVDDEERARPRRLKLEEDRVSGAMLVIGTDTDCEWISMTPARALELAELLRAWGACEACGGAGRPHPELELCASCGGTGARQKGPGPVLQAEPPGMPQVP